MVHDPGAGGFGRRSIAQFLFCRRQLLQSQGRVRIRSQLVGGVCKVALGEENVAGGGFEVAADQLIARVRGQ